MRRVKFRGKILKEKGLINAGEWIEGGYYRDDCYGGCPEGKHYIIQWNSGYGGFTDLIEVDGSTVGEWTSLRDKNGKEIYEGDVMFFQGGNEHQGYREFSERVVVEFVGAEFALAYDSRGTKVFCSFGHFDKEDCEIIGNIYENPELMEASQ